MLPVNLGSSAKADAKNSPQSVEVPEKESQIEDVKHVGRNR